MVIAPAQLYAEAYARPDRKPILESEAVYEGILGRDADRLAGPLGRQDVGVAHDMDGGVGRDDIIGRPWRCA